MSLTKEDLKQNLEKIKEEYKTNAEMLFKAYVMDFFKTHENVESIRWNQYVPYFNEGDTCEFSIDEVTV